MRHSARWQQSNNRHTMGPMYTTAQAITENALPQITKKHANLREDGGGGLVVCVPRADRRNGDRSGQRNQGEPTKKAISEAVTTSFPAYSKQRGKENAETIMDTTQHKTRPKYSIKTYWCAMPSLRCSSTESCARSRSSRKRGSMTSSSSSTSPTCTTTKIRTSKPRK